MVSLSNHPPFGDLLGLVLQLAQGERWVAQGEEGRSGLTPVIRAIQNLQGTLESRILGPILEGIALCWETVALGRNHRLALCRNALQVD